MVSYRDKHYEVVEFDLSTHEECPYCNKVFVVDYKYLKYVQIDNDWGHAKIHCPYCGKHYYKHV